MLQNSFTKAETRRERFWAIVNGNQDDLALNMLKRLEESSWLRSWLGRQRNTNCSKLEEHFTYYSEEDFLDRCDVRGAVLSDVFSNFFIMLVMIFLFGGFIGGISFLLYTAPLKLFYVVGVILAVGGIAYIIKNKIIDPLIDGKSRKESEPSKLMTLLREKFCQHFYG